MALTEPTWSRARRISVRSLLKCALALTLLIATASCAVNDQAAATTPEPSAPTATPTASELPKKLTCPSGRSVATDGGLLMAGAELNGTETAAEAVKAWMTSQGGTDYVLTGDASGAWVLRADGTAQAKVNLLLSDGWLVHGYEACA